MKRRVVFLIFRDFCGFLTKMAFMSGTLYDISECTDNIGNQRRVPGNFTLGDGGVLQTSDQL